MRSKKQMNPERAKELLFDLAANDPGKIDEIKQLSRYIELLEETIKSRSMENSKSEESAIKFSMVKGMSTETSMTNPLFHRYHWTHTALLERHKGSENAHLQVSREDFEKVILTIQTILKSKDTVNTSLIQKQLNKCIKKPKTHFPLTQLYLCLRYLKAAGLLAKCGGSYYQYTGPSSQRSFKKEAELIEKTAGRIS